MEPKTASSPKIYTITELTRNIKMMLEERFPGVWLDGEISNLRIPASGHMYFTLKDAGSQIAAVLFRGAAQSIKFQPKDGQAVLAYGEISLYEKSGQYQIIVRKIEPKGIGALQLAFQQLKEKLEKEGLFDPARKKPIPMLPQKIGIVTSPTGAAIRDMLNVIGRRFSNIHILINPVRVQGEGASLEIARAVDEFNAQKEVNVIIVARGGGSLEDLWSFNEEPVARAIARSKIPVISAVGHEIDFTISDFVADLRAPTPSAAAEIVVKQKGEFLDKINLLAERVTGSLRYLLETLTHRVKYATGSYVFREPAKLVAQYAQRVDELEGRLKQHLTHLIEMEESRLHGIFEKMEALNPLKVLKRGYSLTTLMEKEKIVIRSADVKVGDTLLTRLSEGRLVSRVEKVEE